MVVEGGDKLRLKEISPKNIFFLRTEYAMNLDLSESLSHILFSELK